MKTIAIILLAVISASYAQPRPCLETCKDLLGPGPCATRSCGTASDFFFCQRTCSGCTPCRGAPEVCDPSCKDVHTNCGVFTLQCHDFTTALGIKVTYSMCRAHCQVCTACTTPPPKPSCQRAEECRDEIPTGRCENYSYMCGSRNARFTQACRRTCGVCQVCHLPPTLVPCTHDCKDINPASICTNHKYACGDSYPLFTSRCQKTCGKCRLCEPTEPTPMSCENCIDEVPSCEYWAGQGFCDPARGYPNVLRTCPLMCGVCKPCPEEYGTEETEKETISSEST